MSGGEMVGGPAQDPRELLQSADRRLVELAEDLTAREEKGRYPDTVDFKIIATVRDELAIAIDALDAASRFDSPPETEDDRLAILEMIVRQATQLSSCDHRVTCPCGRTVQAAIAAFKCYSCGIYFCDPCARRHFDLPKRPSYPEGGSP